MTDPEKNKRSRLRKYNEEHRAVAAQWGERGYAYPPPVFPSFPDDLRDLRCGATTRKGTPCKRTDLYHSGRCKLHGGLSTGPVSDEGRKRCREAALRRWAKVRAESDGTP
ncbi:HGGxSTG domain-containing protein [Aromatoleum toluclasticum]|uniref:HGGxSTG domain-containing protein n=1 Tax=Aromatoleum toluclasticum TaxID=92003 RepID=UPI001D1838CD|nr:HGGxSTG domain-containing protein [Aromatoleum toluclasticum]